MEVRVREKCEECNGVDLTQSYQAPCSKCQGEGHTVRWVPIEELPLAVEVKRLRLGLSALDGYLLEMGERS